MVAVHTELGAFLKWCRSQVRPEDIGLPLYGERRRVAGLRREELAQLAGLSASYYTRLEQGQSQHPSDEVLTALARALRLDDGAATHLRNLARGGVAVAPAVSAVEWASPGMVRLLDAMGDVPAVILGLSGDFLAWNRSGHALWAWAFDYDAVSDPSSRPNMSRLLFLDPAFRSFYVEWERKARTNVAHLRMILGRYPDDARLAALIGELCVRSPSFAELWADRRAGDCDTNTKDIDHPLVGRFTMTQEMLRPNDNPEQLLVSITAEPGSPSEAALRLLGTALDVELPAAHPVRV